MRSLIELLSCSAEVVSCRADLPKRDCPNRSLEENLQRSSDRTPLLVSSRCGSQTRAPLWLLFRRAALCALVSIGGLSHAQNGKTYCNPLDLDYQYNFEQRERNISYRSGADPVLINHQGQYYLFGTIAAGFWHSTNLRDWRHVKPRDWPAMDMVAPAALSAKGKL